MKNTSLPILFCACLMAAFSCGKDEPQSRPDVVVPTKPDDKTPETTEDYSLGELAAMQDIKLGAAFTYWEYRLNAQVPQILKREFNAVTFGNEMKHDAIVKANGTMEFSTADEMVQWAKDCGVDLFGHVLGWHSQQQTDYLSTLKDDAAVDEAFKNYVYGMVEHFDVYAWDVVNETFADGGNGAFRTVYTTQPANHVYVWGSHYPSTKDWVDKAFEYAADACKKYGKKPVLYINDYNLETDAGKRKGICDYAKNNPNVTGVATQMHIDMAIPDLKNKISETLKALVATGKMVRIAELDIKTQDINAQADMFRYIFEQYIAIVPAAQRGGITFWGINDKDSWVGEENHPLLWMDSIYNKKPAYDAIYNFLLELNGLKS